jgi:hypothetical protein
MIADTCISISTTPWTVIYAALRDLVEPRDREQERALAAARAAHHPDLGARVEPDAHLGQHDGQVVAVAAGHVLEGDGARPRPGVVVVVVERPRPAADLAVEAVAVVGQALHGRHVGLGEGVLADHVLEVAAELDAVEQRER